MRVVLISKNVQQMFCSTDKCQSALVSFINALRLVSTRCLEQVR